MRLKSIFLICRKLAETTAFYRDTLGLKALSERRLELAPGVELHLHGELSPVDQQRYGLWNPHPGGREGVVLSLRVDSLSPFEGTPVRAPWGDRLLIVRDPEGNQIELAESLKERLTGRVQVLGDDALADYVKTLCTPVEQEPDVMVVTNGSWQQAVLEVARGGTILALGAAQPDESLDTTRLHYDQITILALPGWEVP